MFNSLKSFIELRLGTGLITDEIATGYGYFIKTEYTHLDRLISFLKTDPDLRLNLLDQIVALPKQCTLFPSEHDDASCICICYQLKSLKLPYRVGLVIHINTQTDSLKSIVKHFLGARWLEEDISQEYDLIIEDMP
jgi:hypothetical protein